MVDDPRGVDRPDRTSGSLGDIDRDYILRGDDAVAYGLVDHVIERRGIIGAVEVAASA